jgi:2'-5' RNA ligase
MIFEPVNVVYRGVGAFPSMKHPRIIWVGVDPNTTSKLTDIARGVEDRLKPLGFKSDKQFTPHITLLRVKEGNSNRTRSRRSEDVGGDALATAIGKHSSTYFGSDTLDEIKVKKSDLMREGPVYTDMFSIKASSGLGSK